MTPESLTPPANRAGLMHEKSPAEQPLGSQVLVLANPYSGHRNNRRYIKSLEENATKLGIQTRVCWHPDEMAGMLRDGDPAGWRSVVVAGGDGSLAGSIGRLREAGRGELPVALLPVGNENLYAKHFGMPLNPKALAGALAAHRLQPVDLGLIQHPSGDVGLNCFNLMVSTGLDAEVVRRVSAWRADTDGKGLKRASRSAYMPRLLGAIREYDYPMVQLESDTGETVAGAHVLVFNAPRYGGGLGFGQGADPDDGMLDWLVLREPKFGPSLGYAIWSYLHRHRRCRSVAFGRARQIRLTGPRVPVQADGDELGFTQPDQPIELTVQRRGLTLVAPL